MIDDLIYDLQSDVVEEHGQAAYMTDPAQLCEALGLQFMEGGISAAGNGPAGQFVMVKKTADPAETFEDGMHEISHALTTRTGYERAIEYFHASVPDMTAHKEMIVEYVARLMMMPEPMFRPILERYGQTPEGIWELHRASGAPLRAAGLRMIQRDFDTPKAFFLTSGDIIAFAASTNVYLTFWVNDGVGAAERQFGRALQMFHIPGTRNKWIGLAVRPDLS